MWTIPAYVLDTEPGRCLKKLVLDAEAMGFGDSERAAGSRWDPLGESLCPEGSTGGNRVYNRNCRRVKKLIPGEYNLNKGRWQAKVE